MNETLFLSELRKRLVERGVTESDADKYAEQFKRYFVNLPENELEEQINSPGVMDGIVNNLAALIEAKKAHGEEDGDPDFSAVAPAPSDPEGPSTEQTASPGTASGKERGADNRTSDGLPESDDEFIAATVSAGVRRRAAMNRANKPPVVNMPPREGQKIIHGSTRTGQIFDGPEEEAPHYEEQYPIAADTAPGAEVTDSTEARGRHRADRRNGAQGAEDFDTYPDYDDWFDVGESDTPWYYYRSPERKWADLPSQESKKYFWGILLGTLPVTVPLLALVAAAFAFVFLAMAAAIAAMILIVVGSAVAGTGFSLVSIIYGVTQIFGAAGAAVGMYEIGIGVVSAGLALMVGILVYNAAIRLMPIAIKYLIWFFFYTVDKIKLLVYLFREECAKKK